MTNNNLAFFVHNTNLAPSYSVPALDDYQSQKNIQVVTGSHLQAVCNVDPLCFGREKSDQATAQTITASKSAFFALRLEMALGLPVSSQPSYFPGATIPSPGGASCSEVDRGNLLFDQFQYLLSFDNEMLQRLSQYQDIPAKDLVANRNSEIRSTPSHSRLFCREESSGEAWLWLYASAPALYFLHQASPGQKPATITPGQATEILASAAARLYARVLAEDFATESVIDLLTLIADAWFSPNSGLAPVSWGKSAIDQAALAMRKYQSAMSGDKLLPFLFELEAMASHISLAEDRQDRESFARGVFAGNFIEVAMAPITSIKATELCVRERLFDEVINLSSRGFAPVVINEYGLVADGNHRLTASYIWNILKYCQDLEWSLENDSFQKRVAVFAHAVQKGLLKRPGQISPVSLHQALSHLSYFLCRPDWRARLNSYTRPLLKRHDFITELPVVVLPEYLSGAVVKSLYDDGETIERACPSLYEAMSLNNHLVLPPRASYHFTDAALLPWFTLLKSSCGTKRRASAFGPRARVIPKA